MTTSGRLGRLAAVTATLALAALPATASAASAASSAQARAGNTWTTIYTYSGAKHQACKVLANDGAAWRVKNRLVNGNRAEVGADMFVERNGKDTERSWSSGLVPKGETSAVGSVLMPKGDDRYTLVRAEYEANAGTGGPIGVGQIGRC